MTDETRTIVRGLKKSGVDGFSGLVAVITGGGMSDDTQIGTGAAMAHLFAEFGAKVFVIDMSSERGRRTVDSIATLGREAQSYEADVTSPDMCKTAVAEVVSTWGRIDILVNNVGSASATPVDKVELEEWNEVFRVNVTGALLMTQAAAASLVRTKGAIVNISSIAGIRCSGYSAYGTSKAALIQLTRETAYALGPRGVRANCIVPGHIYASMTGGQSEIVRRRRRLANLLGTEGTPWDVATTARFLASQEARWITGAALAVDAGSTSVLSVALEHLHGEESDCLSG